MDDELKKKAVTLNRYNDDKDSHSRRMQRSASRLELPALIGPQLSPSDIYAGQNLASEFYSRLAKWIGDFDKSLDQEFEVGIRLVSFGQSFTFHLTDMDYWNPSLIAFIGVTDDESPVKLIQHVSQISILLLKMKRRNPDEKKRPIGFLQDADDTRK